jgi:hypothetical protein
MSKIPSVVIRHHPTFVPAVDKDGNGLGGIRLPDVTVPLVRTRVSIPVKMKPMFQTI